MLLGKTARQHHGRRLFRQRGVGQRIEHDHLGACRAQQLGVFRITERERRTAGERDDRMADHVHPGRPGRVTAQRASELSEPHNPMHVGHARNAAYGDALARMLEFAGERVSREFYLNDAGTQIRVFGESVRALARGEAVPRRRVAGRVSSPSSPRGCPTRRAATPTRSARRRSRRWSKGSAPR